MSHYLALDIGGTNIKYGILNQHGELITKDKFATQDNQTELLENIVKLAQQQHSLNEIQGIAISAPGMIDAEQGHLITAGALLSMYDFPLKAELERQTGLPVEVENDVNCVALAEKWLGKGQSSAHFICLTIGTGIGGAIIINDQLYRGQNHMAGEFGFMLGKNIENDQVSRSTLSAIASTRGGLIKAYHAASGETLTGEEISARYQQQDDIAVQVVSDFTDYLAIGIYNLIFALDPQKVLLGGAISANKDFMGMVQDKVSNLVNQQPYLSHVSLPTIEPCQFNNDSGLIGALYHFLARQK